MKHHLEYHTTNTTRDEDSQECVETRSVLAWRREMKMDSLGAGNQIYPLPRAVVVIAHVQRPGMDKKGSTVAERVNEVEHVPLIDTSHRQAPRRLPTWYRGGLLLSVECDAAAPTCTQYIGMMIPDKSLSRNYTLECSYPGPETYHVQCRRHMQRGMSGHCRKQVRKT